LKNCDLWKISKRGRSPRRQDELWACELRRGSKSAPRRK